MRAEARSQRSPKVRVGAGISNDAGDGLTSQGSLAREWMTKATPLAEAYPFTLRSSPLDFMAKRMFRHRAEAA